MFKKIFALAATALISLNASAAYVQYNFSGPITGYVVQHDDDQSIAYYNLNVLIAGAPSPQEFRLNLSPMQGDGSTRITSATTYFADNGPTNFAIFSNYGGDQTTNFRIDFVGAAQGNLTYTASYSTSIYFSGGDQHFNRTFAGGVTVGTINPAFAQALDGMGGYYEGMGVLIPQFVDINAVPEPASLALFAIGALAAAGTVRRRKTAGMH